MANASNVSRRNSFRRRRETLSHIILPVYFVICFLGSHSSMVGELQRVMMYLPCDSLCPVDQLGVYLSRFFEIHDTTVACGL